MLVRRERDSGRGFEIFKYVVVRSVARKESVKQLKREGVVFCSQSRPAPRLQY